MDSKEVLLRRNARHGAERTVSGGDGGFQIFKKEVIRFPRLDTVLMIEGAIRNAKGDLTVRDLWMGLPKKVMWQTYLATLDYLEYSGKIHIGKDRHVIWIWDPKAIGQLKKKGLVVR